MKALEELVEDALVAYLKTAMPGDVRVYPSLFAVEDGTQYPYVGVEAGESENVTDEGQFNGRRMLEVAVDLAIEGTPIVDDTGVVIQTLRERNRELREALWTAIAWSDTHARINAALGWTYSDGVWSGGAIPVLFSMTHPGRSVRSVEGREVHTVITLGVIAQPTQ